MAGVGVGRISARAILIDDRGQLLLIRRTRPGWEPYWTTAGGGVEPDDASVEAAMHREIGEEMGAVATSAGRVFLVSRPSEHGVSVQQYFLAKLVSLDISTRNGPEFSDPTRGSYDVERYDLYGDDLAAINLRPPELKAFILANREALLHEIGVVR